MGEMKKVVNLSKKELEEANDLINQVESYDHTYCRPYLSNQYNYFPDMPSFILYYNEKQLVGLLTLYADEDPKGIVDITINVLPDYRRHKIGTKLFTEGLKILKKYNFQNYDFMSEQRFLDNNPDFLKNIGLQIEPAESEYQMSYKNDFINVKRNEELEVRKLKQPDVEQLLPLYSKVFATNTQETRTYLQESLNEINTKSFVLLLKKEIIGYCSIDVSDTYYIFGLFIAEKYQNRGLGTYFIKWVMKILLESDPKAFVIGVDESNKIAHHLYLKVGFKDQTKVVYLSK
ncbi:GNAT family N-acetyltransferase [Lactobacillus acetotolerans]|uniref:GNAT family N-acetyltransferase n=1 Tax=Lactobacillus acetotolerans TaxID=1600 RepID=A0A5P5ZM42_9LACO|nr:GNAT family N-acetyltransferase [Lactobacillus acetotolerans]KRN38027.1 acetyltransferasegnat family [Lactobacillus acetotolerans DSM 20749 = JCM 3825]QFG51711.1 GNAT family N-acetyltransferase [Lactobacillus acetotolerans]GGV18122.1 acetyltransferase [Lactobacillus acetotolerans DSM 20749 = JCM 3825]